ncbi:hypothetical protein VTJ49DRAFT_7569 [Mycothermus thermophilus]|uniref:Uncharacterized protein n=1 Tax=Humicola insolens TaxID=85995 RepID=A0ABR3VI00_HUMIN
MPPATPAPPRFVIKRPSTQQAQGQTPTPSFARGSGQFQTTPRFTVSTPRPTPGPAGLNITTPALAFKSSTIRRTRATQEIIEDSSPVSPEHGSPSASPIKRDSLPEPIDFDSSLVQQSPGAVSQGGRSAKRRRISIASDDGTDPIVSSQPPEASDLGSLPDATGDCIASYHTDSEIEDNVGDEHDNDDIAADISPTQSIPSPQHHLHDHRDPPSANSDDDEPILTHPKRPKPFPTFRTPAPAAVPDHHAPRFVKRHDPAGESIPGPDGANAAAVAYLTADLFSPPRPARRHKAGTADRYLAGGLAAELRDWLVEAKGGVDGEGEVKAASEVLGVCSPISGAVKVVVDEVSGASLGLTLVAGRLVVDGDDSGAEKRVRMMLAGDGEVDGLGAGVGGGNAGGVRPGAVVAVAPPVWDIELGERWAVASRWKIVGPCHV